MHDFYEKHLTDVQTLGTMGKFKEVKLDLRDIRADLVINEDKRQECDFEQMLTALNGLTETRCLATESWR